MRIFIYALILFYTITPTLFSPSQKPKWNTSAQNATGYIKNHNPGWCLTEKPQTFFLRLYSLCKQDSDSELKNIEDQLATTNLGVIDSYLVANADIPKDIVPAFVKFYEFVFENILKKLRTDLDAPQDFSLIETKYFELRPLATLYEKALKELMTPRPQQRFRVGDRVKLRVPLKKSSKRKTTHQSSRKATTDTGMSGE